MTRVVAPSRLHFGLLHVPVAGLIHWPDGTPVRHFGGLGLMIDRPGLEVRVEPADEWSATGPLADRALGFAYRLTGCKPDFAGRHFRIDVIHAPPEHVGLGVGTQFGHNSFLMSADRQGSSRATHSMCGVWGNMSNGVSSSSR